MNHPLRLSERLRVAVALSPSRNVTLSQEVARDLIREVEATEQLKDRINTYFMEFHAAEARRTRFVEGLIRDLAIGAMTLIFMGWLLAGFA